MTTLLVRTHGRWDYLGQALDSIDLDLFDRKILSCDGCFPPIPMPGWTVVSSADRRGLSANVAQAWSLLRTGEIVFDTEDDFVIHDLPLADMRKLLAGRPHLAQVVLERQPLNPSEVRNGGLLGADNIPTFTSHKGWREHRHLFSFNPHLRVHDATLRPGTETEVTAQMSPNERRFAWWGDQGDAPRCEHIGVEGGMGSVGWAA